MEAEQLTRPKMEAEEPTRPKMEAKPLSVDL